MLVDPALVFPRQARLFNLLQPFFNLFSGAGDAVLVWQGIIIPLSKESNWVPLDVWDHFPLNKSLEPSSCFTLLDHQAPWFLGIKDHLCPSGHAIQFCQDSSCLHLSWCYHGKIIHECPDCWLLTTCCGLRPSWLCTRCRDDPMMVHAHDEQDGRECASCHYPLLHWLPLFYILGGLES